jgi:hypothetical protein
MCVSIMVVSGEAIKMASATGLSNTGRHPRAVHGWTAGVTPITCIPESLAEYMRGCSVDS